MNEFPTVQLFSEPFEDAALLRFPALSRVDGLVHAVTTQPWNMAPHRGPHAAQAIERRRRICEHLGVPFQRLTAAEQIHSHHVVRVRPSDVGAGRMRRDDAVRFVDGLVCDLAQTPLLQLSADCPLLLVVDPPHRALGVAHASWRGTVSRIAEHLVALMQREFASRPDALRAGICPCAGASCYEVGEEVARIARNLLPDADQFLPRLGGKYAFDLRAANAAQLQRAGVPAAHIEVAGECTITDPRFFSHRREGAQTGRFALIAAWH